MIEQFLSISLSKIATGGWSKWGGARMSLKMLLNDKEWYCQACQEEQTKNMPSYLLPMFVSGGDYAKICANCKNVAQKKKFNYYSEVRNLVVRLKTHY